MKTLFGTAGALLLASGSMVAEPADKETRFVVQNYVPRPWYAPWFLVRSRMEKAVPEYQAVKGLTFKMFTIDPAKDGYGGIYLFSSEETARSRFSAEYIADRKQRYGDAFYAQIFRVVRVAEIQPSPDVAIFDRRATVMDVEAPDAQGTFEKTLAASGLIRAYLVEREGRFVAYHLFEDKTAAESFAQKHGTRVQILEIPVSIQGKNL